MTNQYQVQRIAAAAVITALASVAQAQQPPDEVPMMSMDNVAYHGFLYAGGEYVEYGNDVTMGGAMYVEVMVPHEIQHDYPIVFLHGAGQTGVDYLQTPDGRPGWAYDFIDMGYVVYVQDFPARGRSSTCRRSTATSTFATGRSWSRSSRRRPPLRAFPRRRSTPSFRAPA